jgi:signal peptidase I
MEAERKRGWFVDTVIAWGPALLAVLMIRAFVFEPFRIPSGSMVPSLLIGDQVLVTKFSYGIWLPFTDYELIDLGDPERGDIIVFEFPRDPSLNYIKRVVGLPGDTLAVRDNRITVNGQPQPVVEWPGANTFDFVDDKCRVRTLRHWRENLDGVEHEILTSPMGATLSQSEITVPPDHVFVMGDNRDNSEDSRAWGFVRFDQIKGKAQFVWISIGGCEGDKGVRTDRLFYGLYQ